MGMDHRESLAFAVATGTASALAESVGAVDLGPIERLRQQVAVSADAPAGAAVSA